MSDIGWYLNLLLLAGGPIVTITLQTRTWIKTRIPDGFSPYVSAVVTFTHLLMMFWCDQKINCSYNCHYEWCTLIRLQALTTWLTIPDLR